MSSSAKWMWVFVLVGVVGFFVPFWPLSALCVVLLALSGRWFVAVLMGLFFDLAWGAPLGWAHYVYAPFMLLAVAAALVRLFGGSYLIDRDLPERL
jgi:hypothetical protein